MARLKLHVVRIACLVAISCMVVFMLMKTNTGDVVLITSKMTQYGSINHRLTSSVEAKQQLGNSGGQPAPLDSAELPVGEAEMVNHEKEREPMIKVRNRQIFVALLFAFYGPL